MKKKRLTAALLLLCLLLSLCACGTGDEAEIPMSEPGEGLTEGWIAQTIPIPEDINGWNGMTEEFSLSEGVIWFGTKKDGFPAILSYDTASGAWGELEFDRSGLSDLASVRGLSVSDGLLWALLCSWPENGDPEFSLVLCELNAGTPAQRVSIPFRAELDTEGNRPIFTDLYALDGESALLCDHANAYRIDRRGEKLQTIPLNGCWSGNCCRVDGELYFGGQGDGFLHFNRERGCFEESFQAEPMTRCESENGHLFTRGSDRTMLGVDCASGEKTAFFNWMDVALDTQSLGANKLIETASGDCYYPARHCLVKVSRGMVRPRTELKLLCFMEDEEFIPDSMQGAGQYMDAILFFNNTDPDYKIRVTTISGSKEEMTKDLIRLATAGDYDLIDTGILPDGAMDSGLLTDLLPFLDADPELSREDFIPNVLNGMLRGGKLYAVTPYVQIMTWCMREEEYPGKDAWNIEAASRMISARGDAQVLFWTHDQTQMAKILTKMATAEFVDYENASCCFDDGRFAQWLELLRTLPYSPEFSEVRCLFEPMFELNAATPGSVRKSLRSQDYVFCGFPGASGSGHYFARVGQNLGPWISDPSSSVSMGILERSQHKEAAWRFLKILLQYNEGSGVPVLAARLDGQLAAAVTEEELQGYPIFTEKDAEAIRNLVYAADKTVREDQPLLELICEVVTDCLAGRYTPEEAAANLQSRASIYISEQYG